MNTNLPSMTPFIEMQTNEIDKYVAETIEVAEGLRARLHPYSTATKKGVFCDEIGIPDDEHSDYGHKLMAIQAKILAIKQILEQILSDIEL